eukprot:scaffold95058_cov30-Tisochrysis_lutea.AAC.1
MGFGIGSIFDVVDGTRVQPSCDGATMKRGAAAPRHREAVRCSVAAVGGLKGPRGRGRGSPGPHPASSAP